MNLERQLQRWTSLGLIASGQADAIREHESREGGKDGGDRPWAMYGVAGIGITAMITGLISLVASNWELIPVAVKLGVYLVAQAALGIGVIKQADRPGLLREALLTLFALLLLGGIGLISQIYHLRSDGWQGVLFWLLLALPVTLIADSRMINHLWMAGLSVAAGLWTASVRYEFFDDEKRFIVLTTLALTVAGMGMFRTKHLRLSMPFRRAAVQWGLLAMAIGSVLYSVLWARKSGGWFEGQPGIITLMPWLGVVVACGAVILSTPPYARRLRQALIATFGLFAMFTIVPHVYGAGHWPVAGAIAFMVMWAVAGAASVYAGQKRIFDVIAFIIAARFVVVYFEVFGSLAATGIGLILSGGVILAVAFLWHKYRRSVATWLGGPA